MLKNYIYKFCGCAISSEKMRQIIQEKENGNESPTLLIESESVEPKNGYKIQSALPRSLDDLETIKTIGELDLDNFL